MKKKCINAIEYTYFSSNYNAKNKLLPKCYINTIYSKFDFSKIYLSIYSIY